MRRLRVIRRRGLTFLELMLALTITAMVSAAIASMLGVVTTGVVTRRDNRSVLIRANAAQARLGAYVAPALRVLDATDGSAVLWLDDRRRSETVHATEIRWLRWNAKKGSIDVEFVSFPASWTQAARDLADVDYAVSTRWWAVRDDFDRKGHLAVRPLVDGLVGTTVVTDRARVLEARQVCWRIDIATDDGSQPVQVTASLRRPLTPRDP